MERTSTDFDYVLVGGGLQNGLCALAIADRRPAARIALVERASALGGNHTWCFHAADVDREARTFVDRLVVRRWDGYDVMFPTSRRTMQEPYAAVTSARLAAAVGECVKARAGSTILLDTEVTAVAADHVALASGDRLTARVVIDARGPERRHAPADMGFQKFVGLELELGAPSPRTRPLLMDARVVQSDGYRFFYVLPLAERRALVEETFFSDSADVDEPALRPSILAYAASQGFEVSNVLRSETGVLPLPLRPPALCTEPPLRAGYGGGWFHPATGYSFPVAARLAAHVAAAAPEDVLAGSFRTLVAQHARQSRFACLLNRLLFRACSGNDRVNVFERFYRLPRATIRRFYAMTTTALDRFRILVGRPPRGVSVRAALLRGVLA